MKSVIPENFRRLWAAEDELMGWAADIIAKEEYLGDHLDLVEAYMDCVMSVKSSGVEGERHVAIVGLFLRTFDALSHAVRAAVSGNYSGCAMYARDLLETNFLLSYLMEEEGRPEEWLASSPDEARKRYRPAAIREALDERDGFKEQKRLAHYRALSALGSHPSPAGFELKRDGTRHINVGPFKQATSLKQCLQETAIAALLLSDLLVTFCRSEVADGVALTSRLSIARQRTREKYLKRAT